MSRHLYFKGVSLGDIEDIVPIVKGGTSADNALDAVVNIGGIHKSRLNKPGGVAQTDENGDIPLDLYPPALLDMVTLTGPSRVKYGSSNVFTMTNFDSFKSYTISSNITRDKEKITYVAPMSGKLDSFSVNTKIVEVILEAPVSYSVKTPGIAPVAAAVALNLFTTNVPFEVVASDGTSDVSKYVLLANTWELSKEDGAVISTGAGVYNIATKLCTWTNIIPMVENTTYKVKVTFTSTGATPATSNDLTFKTKTSFGGGVTFSIAKPSVVLPDVTPVVTYKVDNPTIILPTV